MRCPSIVAVLTLLTLPAAAQVAPVGLGMPDGFAANLGQVETDAAFVARSGRLTGLFADDGFVLQVCTPDGAAPLDERGLPTGPRPVRGVNVRCAFSGAAKAIMPRGIDPLEGRVSYFRGSTPADWITNVPRFGGVRYDDVWPGVSLVVTLVGGVLDYTLEVAPGADVSEARMTWQGVDDVGLATGRELVAQTALGALTLGTAGVQGAAPSDDAARRALGVTSPPSQHVFIGPHPTYLSYLGGDLIDEGYDVAIDDWNGHVRTYVVGYTQSTVFLPPLPGPFESQHGGVLDGFVAKLTGQGHALVYASYLGGTGTDLATAVTVTDGGQACVTGLTSSSDYPTQAAFQGTFGGGPGVCPYDAFVTKLTSDGSALVYSTYLGGSDCDQGFGIDVDDTGRVYATGLTVSTDFPLQNPYWNILNGNGSQTDSDAFITKFEADGASLVYSTYVSGAPPVGAMTETGMDIAVDDSGNAHVIIETNSDFLPLMNAVQPNGFTPGDDAYTCSFSADGSTLLHGTFLGGPDKDSGHGIAVDDEGFLYLTGYACSSEHTPLLAKCATTIPAQNGFPITTGAWDTTWNDPSACTGSTTGDAWVAKIDWSTGELCYSTFLGGTGVDNAWDLAIDACGSAYIVGNTDSQDFPTTARGFDRVWNGAEDGFIARLNSSGSKLENATYLGGRMNDVIFGVAYNTLAGWVHVAGSTASANMPISPMAFDYTYGGNKDAFVAKVKVARDASMVNCTTP